MTKGTIITIIFIIGVLLLGAGYTYLVQKRSHEQASSQEVDAGLTAATKSTYTDLSGDVFNFSDHSGKVQVVNSWATWCPFCVQELSDFETLATEYQDKNVVVIAVNRKEDVRKINSFLETVGVFSNTLFVIDKSDAYYTAIGGFTMPETIFYDSKGQVVFHKRGSMILQEMRKYTQDALRASN
jgi:thiol-disulfide isomerase/thioredoxin